MPLHTYQCKPCRIRGERLVKMSEANNQSCKGCGEVMTKLISLPAKTPGLWNGDWNEGLSGQGSYDAGLGMVIHSEKQRQKELDKRGWIRESDLGSDWWDTRKAEIKTENAKVEADTLRYKENLDKYNTKEEAVAATWTADSILAGEHD